MEFVSLPNLARTANLRELTAPPVRVHLVVSSPPVRWYPVQDCPGTCARETQSAANIRA